MVGFVFWETPEEIAAEQSRQAEIREEIAVSRMGLSLATLNLLLLKQNFNPNQPRVPAGSTGGGRWTSDGGYIPIGSGTSYRPVGNGFLPGYQYNPLDPKKVNGLLSPIEGQKIAGTLTAIERNSPSMRTEAHDYKNYPNLTTGAILPPSAAGYRTYYVGPGGDNRRLVIDSGSNRIYYTNNHYKSFRVIIAPLFRSNKSGEIFGAQFGEFHEYI